MTIQKHLIPENIKNIANRLIPENVHVSDNERLMARTQLDEIRKFCEREVNMIRLPKRK